MWLRCLRPDRGGVSRDHLSKHQEHTVNAHQHQHRTITSTRRAWGVVVAATFVVAVGALPAAARQDPGQVDTPARSTTAVIFCTLERVGTQFVACDNLTGNGVPAPRWVHER